MQRGWMIRIVWLLAVAGTVASAAVAQDRGADDAPKPDGERLKPAAGRQVEENAAAVTAELRNAIAKDDEPEGKLLRDVVNVESSRWGIRYRDGQLLFWIPVTRTLTEQERIEAGDDAEGRAETTLTQKFRKLLQINQSSEGLESEAVRVIFIDPAAERLYAAFLASGRAGAVSRGQVIPVMPCHAVDVAPCECR